MHLSTLGKEWIYKESSERDVMTVVQKYNIDPIIAQIVLNRTESLEDINDYLNPTIKNILQNPSLLIDLDKGVERLYKAIEEKQKIAIYADYDVDGATSSAILRNYLEEIGIPSTLYIPDRIDEGYGAHPEALEKLKNEQHDLVIMCDCGTTSHAALAHAKFLNLDVIVIDHHTAEIELPDCFALINPKRVDQPLVGKNAFSTLCTAGLAFVFLVAVNRLRRLKQHKTLPDLIRYLDIVALGTVADVMPLQGLNRAFVKQGLKLLNQRCNPGLKMLLKISEIKDSVSAYHLGFHLGPRINAGGRVGKAWLGSELLTTKHEAIAEAFAHELHTYNMERQTIESIVLEQAIYCVEAKKLDQHPLLLVGGKDWHPGVIGIVASRLKEKFNKPTIVVAFDEKGEGKGSGRSVPGVELGEIILEAVQRKLILKGGGHAMAIGLTIHEKDWDAFFEFLNEKLFHQMKTYVPTIYIDKILSVKGISLSFARQLADLEPFGQGNPTPKIKIENVKVKYMSPVGDSHFRIQFVDNNQDTLDAMAFRIKNTFLEHTLSHKHNCLDIVGTIKHDTWNGREKVTFFLEDCYVRVFS